MLADKMTNVLSTGAEICTAGDSSCLMHIGGGLSRLQYGRAHGAPGRDPGLDRMSTFLGLPTAPRSGNLRGDGLFPDAAGESGR